MSRGAPWRHRWAVTSSTVRPPCAVLAAAASSRSLCPSSWVCSSPGLGGTSGILWQTSAQTPGWFSESFKGHVNQPQVWQHLVTAPSPDLAGSTGGQPGLQQTWPRRWSSASSGSEATTHLRASRQVTGTRGRRQGRWVLDSQQEDQNKANKSAIFDEGSALNSHAPARGRVLATLADTETKYKWHWPYFNQLVTAT